MILRKIKAEYFIIFLLAVLFSVRAHYKEISPYVIYPDIASFSERIMVESTSYTYSKDIVHPSIQKMARERLIPFLRNDIDLIAFLKIFSITAYILSITILFLISKKLFSKKTALTVTVLFASYLLTMNTFAGGSLRCLGFISFLLFFLAFIYQKKKLTALFAVTSFIYPYNAPFICILLLTNYLKESKLSLKKKFILVCLLSFTACVALYLKLAGVSIASILQNISLDYKYTLKIDGNWNDNPILFFLMHMILNFQEHTSLYAFYTAPLFFLFILFYQNKTLINQIVIASAVAFTIVTVIADSTVSSRICLFATPFVLSLNIGYILDHYRFKNIILILINIGIALPFLILFEPTIIDFSDYKKTYNYINRIEKSDAMLIGHQSSLDFIPFFINKAAFTTTRVSYYPPLKGIRKYVDSRNSQIISILYSKDLSEIKKGLRDHKISTVFLEDYYYTKEYLTSPHWAHRKHGFLEKIRNFIHSQNPEKHFALYLFVKENYDFKDEEKGVYIMDTKKLLETIT